MIIFLTFAEKWTGFVVVAIFSIKYEFKYEHI